MPYSKVSSEVTLGYLQWLSNIFNDTKHCAVSLLVCERPSYSRPTTLPYRTCCCRLWGVNSLYCSLETSGRLLLGTYRRCFRAITHTMSFKSRLLRHWQFGASFSCLAFSSSAFSAPRLLRAQSAYWSRWTYRLSVRDTVSTRSGFGGIQTQLIHLHVQADRGT